MYVNHIAVRKIDPSAQFVAYLSLKMKKTAVIKGSLTYGYSTFAADDHSQIVTSAASGLKRLSIGKITHETVFECTYLQHYYLQFNKCSFNITEHVTTDTTPGKKR